MAVKDGGLLMYLDPMTFRCNSLLFDNVCLAEYRDNSLVCTGTEVPLYFIPTPVVLQ